MSKVTIHTDGGARGNPGPAAIGVVFDHDDWQRQYCRYIGEGTNNVAEYTAVVDAIALIPEIEEEIGESVAGLDFYLDSELVVRQLLGQYKVKEPTLQILHQEIISALRTLGRPYTFTHVRREQNKLADKLVNQALDVQAR
jgi:ribonuclease HI